jgi:hypothetical protein
MNEAIWANMDTIFVDMPGFFHDWQNQIVVAKC